MRRLIVWTLLVALLGAAGYGGWWWWTQRAPAQAAAAPAGRAARLGGGMAVPVTVAPAAQQDVPITIDALGTVQAYATITVRAQVDGQLIEIAFREGQEVRRGDVLARIDPRSYQAALDQVIAKKAQDEALLANARLDLERYTRLAQNQGVSRQQQDTQRALVAQYEAQVQADQGAIDAARTQLDFTTIRSPVDGRVGLRLVDQGNLVRGSDATGIVTVVQLRPITVVFTLPQQDLPRVQEAMARGPLRVDAILQTPGAAPIEGRLLAMDNQVDATTGTIRIKAEFANLDGRLWPGAYVTARLHLGTVPAATTVPLVAVQRGPESVYAFVLKPDQTVEQRPLVLGPLTQSEAIVRRGVRPGEQVVTSGGLRLSNGARVTVTETPQTPPSDAPTAPPQRRRGPRQAAEATR